MWKICVVALALASSPALAQDNFDGEKVANAYYEARPACRQGEFLGRQISAKENDLYCVFLDALGFQLKANGWCWEKGELVWEKCRD